MGDINSSKSVLQQLTGGINPNDPKWYANRYNSPEDWNNYLRAGRLAESLRPGSSDYGSAVQLPGESDKDYWNRRGTIEDQYNTWRGATQSLSSALNQELGVNNRTKSAPSRGGGGTFYGGGGGPRGQQMAEQPLNFYLGPAPTLQGLNLDYQEMGRRAMEANAPYKQQYEQMNPGLYAGLKAMGQLANQQLAGQVPLDVAQQIGRSSAAAKLGAGISGGGLGRNLTARDLGLSSLSLQQSGADLLAKSSALAQQSMQAMMPIAAGQVFGEAVSQASINQQIGNQNLINAWQSQATPGQFDISKGMFVGYQPGTYSATQPLTPMQQATANLQAQATSLNQQAKVAGNNRFVVQNGKIVDRSKNPMYRF